MTDSREPSYFRPLERESSSARPDRWQAGLAPVVAGVAIRALVLLTGWWQTGSAAWFYLPDSMGYAQLGRSLAEQGSFAVAGMPELFRLPGYPLLVAAATLTGHLTVVTILLQLALAAGTVGLTFRLAGLAGNPRLARVAAWMAACEPLLVAYTGFVLTETLFTLLVLATAYLCITGSGARHFAAAGLLAGCAALTRTVGLFLPLVLALAFVCSHRALPLRLRLRPAAIVALAGIVVIGGWVVRNQRVAGYVGYSSQTDRLLLFSMSGADIAARRGQNYAVLRLEMRQSLSEEMAAAPNPEAAIAMKARRDGWRYVREHWWSVTRRYLQGSVLTVLHPPGNELNDLFARTAGGVAVRGDVLSGAFGTLRTRLVDGGPMLVAWWAARVVYWGAMLALLGIGTVSIARGRIPGGIDLPPRFWPVVVAVLIYFGIASGSVWAEPRFRHPSMPFLCVVAAAGFCTLRVPRD